MLSGQHTLHPLRNLRVRNFQFVTTQGECLFKKAMLKPWKETSVIRDKIKQNLFIFNNDLYFDKQLKDDSPMLLKTISSIIIADSHLVALKYIIF